MTLRLILRRPPVQLQGWRARSVSQSAQEACTLSVLYLAVQEGCPGMSHAAHVPFKESEMHRVNFPCGGAPERGSGVGGAEGTPWRGDRVSAQPEYTCHLWR